MAEAASAAVREASVTAASSSQLARLPTVLVQQCTRTVKFPASTRMKPECEPHSVGYSAPQLLIATPVATATSLHNRSSQYERPHQRGRCTQEATLRCASRLEPRQPEAASMWHNLK